MLRAGLIGFPSSGRTALFQLLTSAREAPARRQGRRQRRRRPGPRRTAGQAHRPFQSEEAGPRDGRVRRHRRDAWRPRQARRRCSTSPRSGTPTRCCTSSGCSATPRSRTRQARSIRRVTFALMEDEVILADLGVVERRLERLERDLKKGNTPELRQEQDSSPALPCRARRGPAASRACSSTPTTPSGCAGSSSSRPSRCCWS